MQNSQQSTNAGAPMARASWPAISFALVFPSALTWLYFIALSGEPAAVQQTAYTVGKLIQFGFPLLWAWLYRRESLGLPEPRLAGVLEGLVFGAAVGGGMLLAYHFWLKPAEFFSAASEPILAKLKGIGLMTPTAFIVLGVFYSLAHSLMEEYYWRWFVFARLTETTRLPTAIAVSSLGFMAHHVLVIGFYFGWTAPETWLFSFAVAIGGAAWAWLYHKSRSLVGPWLSHLVVDAAIFAVGYDLVFGAGLSQ
jgi:membrane protease YdiL (CAAX protease family)